MMSITQERPLAILGGGIAGLTAANYLKTQGVPFVLFEGSSAVAGLMASQRDEEGYTYDCGVHFLTNRLGAAVGIASECLPMKKYGETVYLKGKTYSYPLGLMLSPKYVTSALVGKAKALMQSRAVTAREHYIAQYGRRLAEEIAIPLTEAWSGASGDELSAAVGQKFATGLPRLLMLRAAAKMTNRVIGIGYASTITESTNSWHVYPKDGISAVCTKQAESVQNHVRLNSKIQEIIVENNSVQRIVYNGESIDVSGVISTAPLHVLAKLVRGTQALNGLEKFQYRAMVFINMKLSGSSGLPDVVTWVPERNFPFFRVSDIGMGLPWLVPEGKSQITCDIGCAVGDEVWTKSDEALTCECLESLNEMIPGIKSRFFGSRVVRVPLAYPVYRLEYEKTREAFSKSSGVNGLLSVGRNGEFAHILMEDVYWRTRWKLADFLQSTYC